ncbi:MAG: MBL fold metallo-hydrolase [Planctomycetaceae bacterium]|nr:MBL fold metallo-hydrolase [Planctomycetaceae bacterium]
MQHNRRNFLKTAAILTSAAAYSSQIVSLTNANESDSVVFPDWQEGFLDIHHISTGRGNATFMIAPDGTTLLIDAGDMSDGRPDNTVLPRLPNASKTPGEWIAAYIKQFSKPLKRNGTDLDYVLLTHFHSDHIGVRQKTVIEKNGYALSGITMVAESLGIGKLVDRDFPDYNFPSRQSIERESGKFLKDYLAFIDDQQKNRKTVIEKFVPGSQEQFTLKYAPKKYPFSIQNIAANCIVWTGNGTETQTVFPQDAKPDENMCSCVIKLSYGNFAYFSGGDCSGTPEKRDMETPVANVVGRVDAMSMNHHAYIDVANPNFLVKSRPRVMVIPVWDTWHPHVQTLTRMTDKNIYPDQREIFATGLHEENTTRLGNLVKSIVHPQGHIVIRVTDNGTKYRVFVLNATSETPGVLFTTEEFIACATG